MPPRRRNELKDKVKALHAEVIGFSEKESLATKLKEVTTALPTADEFINLGAKFPPVEPETIRRTIAFSERYRTFVEREMPDKVDVTASLTHMPGK